MQIIIVIADDLWSLFTYPIVIMHPTQEEREKTLLWLLHAYLNIGLNECQRISKDNGNFLNVVSHRTSGFLVGDLEEYVLRVYR